MSPTHGQIVHLVLLSEIIEKLIHHGETITNSDNMDWEGVREKTLEIGLLSRDLSTATSKARLTCVSRD